MDERSRLDSLSQELSSRISRVEELERLVADKEAGMSALKNALTDALNSFEGNGLSVEQRGGKVYVSMENKLLLSRGAGLLGQPENKPLDNWVMCLQPIQKLRF